jgi:NAD-dependent DNA ligase
MAQSQQRVLDGKALDALTAAAHDGQLRWLTGEEIVLTGTMSLQRIDLQRLITAIGGQHADSITQRTTILVASDVLSTSAKMREAIGRGIRVMSEQEFVEWLATPPAEPPVTRDFIGAD